MDNKLLSKSDIIKYLEKINEKLAFEQKNGEIIIAGGASLTIVYGARESTYDIDALFVPQEDMRRIIKDIAIENSLNDDWLNDGVKGFMTNKMKFDEILKFSNLTVYSIEAEGLLAMKLTSARPDTKDMEDSVFLMKHLKIDKEGQLFEIINKYMHPKQQSIRSKFFTQEAFKIYQNSRINNS